MNFVSDSFGVQLEHKLIPGAGGRVGCVVTRVLPGSKAEDHGEVQEGDEIVEINGINMQGKTNFEIRQILDSIRDEADVLCRR